MDTNHCLKASYVNAVVWNFLYFLFIGLHLSKKIGNGKSACVHVYVVFLSLLCVNYYLSHWFNGTLGD